MLIKVGFTPSETVEYNFFPMFLGELAICLSGMYEMGLAEFVIQDEWIYGISSGFNFTRFQKYVLPDCPPLLPRYQKELEEVGKRVTEASNPVLVRYKFK